ncbi:MAG: HEAT repeat domain-containing protein [Ginsengibacter sp.]
MIPWQNTIKMHGSFIHFFLQVNFHDLISVIYGFLVLLVLLIAFIIVYTFYKRKVAYKKKLWRENIAIMISQVIFNEDDGTAPLQISFDDVKLLHKSRFRQYVIDEVIPAKKNLSGSATENLKKLFNTLELDKDSFKKLRNKKWHIKAKGIQELAIMEQVKYVKEIFKLTNNKNESVRNEAQCALVSFYGFEGFRFLNVTTHPISQWQQISLLNNLHDVQPSNLQVIEKWMQSPNESIIIFSLKLATLYSWYYAYDQVIRCLQNPDRQIKLNALAYLTKMPREDTPDEVIAQYSFGDKKIKLAILAILQEVGTEKHLPFLLKQLHNMDDTIKAAAAKTLSYLHPLGIAFLHTHLFADEYPWNAIFLQIEKDRAA